MADQKIDGHTHFLTPTYRTALLENGYTMPDGVSSVPEWSLQSHLAFMDSVGIKKSIISESSPGPNLTSDIVKTIALTRNSNEFAANVKRQHPDRFGFFDSLPMPDIDATIAEIKYAVNELNPDGFALFSNSSGLYLGEPGIRRVLDELDTHSALVFVHPTAPCQYSPCRDETCQTLTEKYAVSSPLARYYSAPMFEFFFDSARSVVDLLGSGTILRFPRIRWIITHCGNVLPLLIDRMLLFMKAPPIATGRDSCPITEEQIRNALKEQFWFDLAGAPLPNLIDALLKFTGKDRLMFGSDVPWTPFELAKGLVENLEQNIAASIGEDNLNLVYRDTAEQLLSQGSSQSVTQKAL